MGGSWRNRSVWLPGLAAALALAACTPNPAPAPPSSTLGDLLALRGARAERPPGAPEQLVPPARGDQARLYPGTGVFVHVPQTAGPGGAPVEGDVTLNFVDADVREVARSVLGDLLHLNYAVDPKVQATITVQTNHPLRREDVLATFQEVLRVSGVALVESGGLYRVVPADTPVRPGEEAVRVGRNAGAAAVAHYDIRVIPLQFIAAAEMQRTVEPFLPKGAQLRADAARNVLIVAGTAGDADTVADLVATFDVNYLAGMSFGIFPLTTGSAKTVASSLGSILGSDAGAPLAGVLRFVPLERINAILAISPQKAYLQQAQQWIERLDQSSEENTARLFAYRVQNSRALDLARVLSQLLTGSQVQTVDVSAGQGPGGAGALPDFFNRPSTQGGTGATGTTGARSAIPGLSQPQPSSSSLFSGGQASDQQAAPAPQGAAPREVPSVLAGGEAGPGAVPTDSDLPKARIVADEKNNTLVIFATPHDYRMIEDVLKKLDIVPLQVLIEATIAEVTLNDNLQYGLQWFFRPGSSKLELSTGTAGTLAATDLTGVFPGFNYVLSGVRTNVILSALSAVTNVNVISSPQLLVQDHRVATLQVGDQVPIPTAQIQSQLTTGAPLVNTIDYRDTGVILRVSPRVNSNGLIALDITQEVSDVTTTTSSTLNAPTINQRRIQSSVTVRDSETIALGGLIRDSRTLGKNGIPLLSDIPIIGHAFRTDQNLTVRTELLVLLSPRIVRDDNDARAMTEELRRRLHSLAPIVPAPPPAPPPAKGK